MSKAGELAGRTLAGRYEILDLVGSGGMGEVYRARDRELDDLVALKVVHAALVSYPDVIERFRREVKLARRVTHPNVARAFELVVADGLTFYTMELVDGVSLVQRLDEQPVLDVSVAASIAVAICDALTAAHAAGIVHRDVKPANILLASDGRVVLTDFGVAAAVREEVGQLQGTPRFMAPEQALGELATPAADLYALGVLLYEMLTGEPAFAGASTAEILVAKQDTPHLVIADVDIDPRLAKLVASATDRDPHQRPATALAFRQLVVPFAAGQTPRRAPAGPSLEAMLPTVIVRAEPAERRPHLVAGLHQAFVDRLVQWPRVRVTPRDAGAPSDSRGAILVELALRDDQLEIAATSGTTALAVRSAFDVDAFAPSVERAARLVAVLAGSDAPPPESTVHFTPPVALELILEARYEARRDRTSLAAGIARCERALAIAPNDPRVAATLATCQAQHAFYGTHVDASLLDAAEAHARAALAAAPDLAEAHFAQAHVELHRGRPVVAAGCFRAAIARAPLMAEAHEWLGRMLLEAGFVVDALARLDDAQAMGPLPALRWELANANALEGRWDEVDKLHADLRGLGIGAGLGHRMRLATWRGDRAAVEQMYAELSNLGGAAMTFERELSLLVFDPVRPWSDRRDVIRALAAHTELPSARRRAFVAQLAAEAAGGAGDIETCLSSIARADVEGLFDVRWLDRCPVLEVARHAARFRAIRSTVATRADAIHDALYGERNDPTIEISR